MNRNIICFIVKNTFVHLIEYCDSCIYLKKYLKYISEYLQKIYFTNTYLVFEYKNTIIYMIS